MKNYNFSTETGIPVTLDGNTEPAFYFYPDDLDFIKKASKLYFDLNKYSEEVAKKYKGIDIEIDEEGVPKNTNAIISVMEEEFNMQLKAIDELLGDGVSEKVFKGKVNFVLFSKFLGFLSQIIEENRQSTINNYIKPKNRAERRAMQRVME